MESDDVFGRDPQVVYLRHVFSTCERLQKDLLAKLGVSDLDVRLSSVRVIALKFFERLLSITMRRDIVNSEEDAGILYVHCFSRSLRMNNITVPTDIIPKNDKISVVMNEVLG